MRRWVGIHLDRISRSPELKISFGELRKVVFHADEPWIRRLFVVFLTEQRVAQWIFALELVFQLN